MDNNILIQITSETPSITINPENPTLSLIMEGRGAKGKQGIQGEKGETGSGINVIGDVPTFEDLPITPNLNDCYLILADNTFAIWNGTEWIISNSVIGPEGQQGQAGLTVSVNNIIQIDGNISLETDDIPDTEDNRFVTDIEKSTWNAKQNALTADVDYLKPSTATTLYEPKKGIDDNYVTDAEKIVIGNTSGTNAGDETSSTIKTKLGITTLSGSNTGDETVSSIKTKLGITTLSGSNTGDNAVNSLYSGLVTNATHTGEVTGSGALTITNKAVTLEKMADMNSASLIYRKTIGSGSPEVNTLATLKTDLGLSGTNTGDQTLSSLGAEAVANKSTNVSTDGLSDTKYPSVKAVKTYADTKEPLKGADDNYVTDAEKVEIATISTKVSTDVVVHNTGNESIDGIKTFLDFPVTPSLTPSSNYQVANKIYVDNARDKNYVHEQADDSNVWIVTHNLNKYPSVMIVDTDNEVIIGDIAYNSLDSLTVSFNSNVAGRVYLN